MPAHRWERWLSLFAYREWCGPGFNGRPGGHAHGPLLIKSSVSGFWEIPAGHLLSGPDRPTRLPRAFFFQRLPRNFRPRSAVLGRGLVSRGRWKSAEVMEALAPLAGRLFLRGRQGLAHVNLDADPSRLRPSFRRGSGRSHCGDFNIATLPTSATFGGARHASVTGML